MAKTAEQLKQVWESQPDQLSEALRKVLVNFGYGVDTEHIRNWIAGFYAGAPPQGGPSMFIHRWLKEGLE